MGEPMRGSSSIIMAFTEARYTIPFHIFTHQDNKWNLLKCKESVKLNK